MKFSTVVIVCLLGLLPFIHGVPGSMHSAIKWNGNWAFSCDFHGNNLANVRIRGEECGPRCDSTPRCTHFTWTTHDGGTCWMKKGRIFKANAFYTQDKSMVCGVSINRHN